MLWCLMGKMLQPWGISVCSEQLIKGKWESPHSPGEVEAFTHLFWQPKKRKLVRWRAGVSHAGMECLQHSPDLLTAWERRTCMGKCLRPAPNWQLIETWSLVTPALEAGVGFRSEHRAPQAAEEGLV